MNTPKHHKEYRYDCAPSETIVADHELPDDDLFAMPSWLEEDQDRADQPAAEPCSSSSGHSEVESGIGHGAEQRKDDSGATPELVVTISPESHWEPTCPDSHIVEEKPDEGDPLDEDSPEDVCRPCGVDDDGDFLLELREKNGPVEVDSDVDESQGEDDYVDKEEWAKGSDAYLRAHAFSKEHAL